MKIFNSISSISSSFSMSNGSTSANQVSSSGLGASTSQSNSSGSFSSMANSLTSMNISLLGSEKKGRDIKPSKSKLLNVMKLLEDVNIQTPQKHSGLVVVFSPLTMAPLSYQGLKFKWYRLDLNDQLIELENSYHAWYAPSADDIGCKICVHCEDDFDQGYTRYVECGPIRPDSLLCSMVEAAIENTFFETKNISISLGTEDISSRNGFSETFEITSFSSTGGGSGIPATGLLGSSTSSMSSQSVGSPVHSSSLSILESFKESPKIYDISHLSIDFPFDSKSSCLSEESNFLRIDGLCSVSIDAQGLFISFPPPPSHSSSVSRTTSPGIRIPSSDKYRVYCCSYNSVVLAVPIRKNIVHSVKSNGNNDSKNKNESISDEDGSRSNGKEFVSSKVLAIPWSYESGNESYFSDSNLEEVVSDNHSSDSEAKTLHFASIMCSLTEFVASIPEKIDEIKICFRCDNRLQRDGFCLILRSLVSNISSGVSKEKWRNLPWKPSALNPSSVENGTRRESIDFSDRNCDESSVNNTQRDLEKRVRLLEQENIELKREKLSISQQLLEMKESIKLKSMESSSSFARNMIQAKVQEKELAFVGEQPSIDDRSSIVLKDSSNDAVHHDDSDTFRQLSMEIIDLQNKISILQKKEIEWSKSSSEYESRLEGVLIELKESREENHNISIQHSILRHEKDTFEKKCRVLSDRCSEQAEKLDVLGIEIDNMRKTLSLNKSIEEDAERWKNEVLVLEEKIAMKDKSLEDVKSELNQIEFRHHQQIELILAENQDRNRKLQEMSEKIAEYESKRDFYDKEILKKKKLEAELNDCEMKCGKQQAEIRRLSQKSEQQGKEIKQLQEQALIINEFDKALTRKSNECNELQAALCELQDFLDQQKGFKMPIDLSKLIPTKIPRSFFPTSRKSISHENDFENDVSEKEKMSIHEEMDGLGHTSNKNYDNNRGTEGNCNTLHQDGQDSNCDSNGSSNSGTLIDNKKRNEESDRRSSFLSSWPSWSPLRGIVNGLADDEESNHLSLDTSSSPSRAAVEDLDVIDLQSPQLKKGNSGKISNQAQSLDSTSTSNSNSGGESLSSGNNLNNTDNSTTNGRLGPIRKLSFQLPSLVVGRKKSVDLTDSDANSSSQVSSLSMTENSQNDDINSTSRGYNSDDVGDESGSLRDSLDRRSFSTGEEDRDKSGNSSLRGLFRRLSLGGN